MYKIVLGLNHQLYAVCSLLHKSGGAGHRNEHDITSLYHGSLHQSNLKGYKVIGFLNTSPFFKGVVYLAFRPFATMV